MVNGTNSTPTGIPIWGPVRENFIQGEIAQLWYSTAVRQPWALRSNPSLARQLYSPHQSALLSSGETSSLFQLSQGNTVFSGKGGCIRRARGELACIDRSFSPRIQVGLSSCKWGPQILTVWLMQYTLSSFGYNKVALVSGNFAARLDGESFSLIG